MRKEDAPCLLQRNGLLTILLKAGLRFHRRQRRQIQRTLVSPELVSPYMKGENWYSDQMAAAFGKDYWLAQPIERCFRIRLRQLLWRGCWRDLELALMLTALPTGVLAALLRFH